MLDNWVFPIGIQLNFSLENRPNPIFKTQYSIIPKFQRVVYYLYIDIDLLVCLVPVYPD
jgi:hypothetical protein